MASFAKFGSDLDVSTQRLLARGERLTELLKQPQYAPLQAEEQVCVLYAGTRGYMDGVPVAKIQQFQSELLSRLHSEGAILDGIRSGKELTPALETQLKGVLDNVVQIFA